MLTETLTPDGPVHWGVMLAQGWKREFADVDRSDVWAAVRAWARSAELLGFHGIWVFDHFQPYPVRDDSPVLEAWTTIAALSQMTENMILGTLVSCAGYRNAQLTAKMAENMALLSGKRFCLGLGAGWDRYEFESLGIPFPTPSRRSDQLEAVLRTCRRRWTRQPDNTHTESPSLRGQGPLLLVGGEGEKRTLRAAAAFADVTNWQVGVTEFIQKSRVLADFCEAAGRDPATVRRTHAPNFQLFESEREFRRWQQSKDRGMSAKEVDAYIRDRGAFYSTAEAVQGMIKEFKDVGCRGFMIFCNKAPSIEGLEELASLLPCRWTRGQ